MSLRKISDSDWLNKINFCRSSEHNPPTMIVLDPGEYEYTCPDCGHKQVFTVPSRSW